MFIHVRVLHFLLIQLEPLIDENSPDEDERQAMEALRGRRRVFKKMIVNSVNGELHSS